jgi:hypothetical protein
MCIHLPIKMVHYMITERPCSNSYGTRNLLIAHFFLSEPEGISHLGLARERVRKHNQQGIVVRVLCDTLALFKACTWLGGQGIVIRTRYWRLFTPG